MWSECPPAFKVWTLKTEAFLPHVFICLYIALEIQFDHYTRWNNNVGHLCTHTHLHKSNMAATDYCIAELLPSLYIEEGTALISPLTGFSLLLFAAKWSVKPSSNVIFTHAKHILILPVYSIYEDNSNALSRQPYLAMSVSRYLVSAQDKYSPPPFFLLYFKLWSGFMNRINYHALETYITRLYLQFFNSKCYASHFCTFKKWFFLFTQNDF